MRRRVSTRIGLSVGALLLLTLVTQVILTRLVLQREVAQLRAKAAEKGMRLLALGIEGGPYDSDTFEHLFADGPALGVYDANGMALARAARAPERIDGSTLARAKSARGASVTGQGYLNVLALPNERGPARYVALVDDHVEALLHQTRMKVLLMIALASALFGAGATFLLARHIRRRLLDTQAVVRRMAQGELDVRLPVASDDEEGQLALDFNRMAERLSTHIEALRAEQVLRKRIYADWTHEIATPLTSVLGYLESLQTGKLEPARATHYLAQAQRQARAIERLTDDLTTLSKLESEGVQLLRQEEDVVDLVKGEVNASAVRAQHLTIACQTNEVICLQLDAARFAQVVRNVLNNAERYAKTRVQVSCLQDGEGVCVSIVDDGEGISTEHLAHLTESFYRVDPSRDLSTGGRGLGLSIARGLTEAHGGKLTIQSVVGEGTTVIIALPFIA